MKTRCQFIAALFINTSLLWGCPAGEPANGPECREDRDCPAGFVCPNFECLEVCRNHDDCEPADACITETCQPYTQNCGRHDECLDGYFCDGGSCERKQPLGSVCGSQDAACKSGTCTQGVCCDGACDSPCMTCVIGPEVGDGDDGACVLSPVGEDPKDDCPGQTGCNNAGSCFDTAQGDSCVHNYECASGFCVDDVCCSGPCNGECETCVTGTCELYVDGTDPEEECQGPLTCNGARACWDGENGDACVNDYECVSGFCVDGSCCNNACDSVCEACNRSGNQGTCAPVVNGTDVGTCDAANAAGDCPGGLCYCDGASSCKLSGAQPCSSSSSCADGNPCMGGICCDVSVCDGSCVSCNADDTGRIHGACEPTLLATDPHDECNGAGATACNGEGACFARTLSQVCEHDYQCDSGFCTDGICCNIRCDGVCYGCHGMSTAAAEAGTCSPILNGNDPDEECEGAWACTDGGSCHDNSAAAGRTCNFDFECAEGSCCGTCYPGWKAMGSGTSADLYGVWGSDSNNVYAVGEGGAIRRFDGNADGLWASEPSPVNTHLRAIHGTSTSSMFAVGDAGKILFGNGTNWTPMDSGTTADLVDVCAMSASVAYAVSGNGKVLRYASGVWADYPGPTADFLSAVECAEGDVYVTGGLHDVWLNISYATAWKLADSSWETILGRSASPERVGFTDISVNDGVAIAMVTRVTPLDNRLSLIQQDGGEWVTTTGGSAKIMKSNSKTFGAGVVAFGTLFAANVGIFNGVEWITADAHANDVWAATDCEAFAVGDNGQILRY